MQIPIRALWTASVVVMLLSTASPAQRPQFSNSLVRGNFRSPTLQETLEKGLKARRPEEFEFIERVVIKVNKRQLPLDLVRSTFEWARRKRPHAYPYFERGLRIRAARLGYTVQ